MLGTLLTEAALRDLRAARLDHYLDLDSYQAPDWQARSLSDQEARINLYRRPDDSIQCTHSFVLPPVSEDPDYLISYAQFYLNHVDWR